MIDNHPVRKLALSYSPIVNDPNTILFLAIRSRLKELIEQVLCPSDILKFGCAILQQNQDWTLVAKEIPEASSSKRSVEADTGECKKIVIRLTAMDPSP
jgi:hypothetical protein